jgi:hypothetical protein
MALKIAWKSLKHKRKLFFFHVYRNARIGLSLMKKKTAITTPKTAFLVQFLVNEANFVILMQINLFIKVFYIYFWYDELLASKLRDSITQERWRSLLFVLCSFEDWNKRKHHGFWNLTVYQEEYYQCQHKKIILSLCWHWLFLNFFSKYKSTSVHPCSTYHTQSPSIVFSCPNLLVCFAVLKYLHTPQEQIEIPEILYKYFLFP